MTLTPIRGSTCLPRFATPRDLRFPTYGTELGEVARRLGTPLMPWQQDAVDVAMEYDPVTGLLRYDEVDITVPRQSGKTTLTLAKKVHRLTVMAKRLGPQRSTYTAQTRLAARKKLERDFANALRTSRSFREVPHARARPTKATEWRLTLNNGSEAIQFGLGNFLQIDAPSRTGGHGDTLDDGTIDEAFSQEDDTVEGAMRPAMATRKNAQLWVISTAGDARSKYLWRKVLAGREASEKGEHGRVCYIEFSAPDDADPSDPAVWWGCMPALGITVTEQFIQGEWERAQRKGVEGINTFRRAYLNQWPEVPQIGESQVGGALDVDRWLTLADPAADRGQPVFGLDVDPDRRARIGVAWTRPDGRSQLMLSPEHLDVPAHEAAAVCKALTDRWGGKVWLGGAAAGLVADFDREHVPYELLRAGTFPAACGLLVDALEAGSLRHGNQPELNEAIAGALWRVRGTAGEREFDLTRSSGVGPLVAVTRALYGLLSSPAEPRIRSL